MKPSFSSRVTRLRKRGYRVALVAVLLGVVMAFGAFSFTPPVFAQRISQSVEAHTSLAFLQQLGEQECMQLPQHANPMTLSDAQLSLYGLPVHRVLESNPAQWSTVLAFAKDHTCTSSPGTISVAGKTVPAPANVTEYANCCWAGNEARGSRGTYRAADVTFTVPTAYSTSSTQNSSVSFWAGVGGDNKYQTTSYELIQAGVSIQVSPSGVQTNHAWWETAGKSGNNGPNYFGFTVHRGDTIYAYVDSNYGNDGYNTYYVLDETTGAYGIHHDPPNYFSDSATGECIGEKNSPNLADFGTKWLNACTICSNSTCKGIASWNHDYYIVTENGQKTGVPVLTVGSINSSGNYPLYWKRAS